MSQFHANKSLRRTALQISLAAATIVAAGRIVQLAVFDSPPFQGGLWRAESSQTRGGSVERSVAAQSDPSNPDVAALYASCPMAAVIDLKTVASDPQKVDAVLPPYLQTVHRVPTTPIEPAIPRIRYPVAVHSSSDERVERDDTVRIAEAPSKPVQRADQVGEGAVTNEPSPSLVRHSSPQASLKGRGNEEWLIDPKEWYAPEDRTTATGAKSDEGADAALPKNQPMRLRPTRIHQANRR